MTEPFTCRTAGRRWEGEAQREGGRGKKGEEGKAREREMVQKAGRERKS